MKTTYVLAAVAVLSMSGQVMAQTPVELGQKVFARCGVCHAVGPNPAKKTGPHLNGLIGRKPASVEGYNWTPSAVEHAKTHTAWTVEDVKKYIADPRAYNGVVKMPKQNVNDTDFANLMAYLATFKADGSPAQ